MKRMEHEESSNKERSNMKRVKKVKHKENIKSERNDDILEEFNMKKVQNGKSAAQRKHEK